MKYFLTVVILVNFTISHGWFVSWAVVMVKELCSDSSQLLDLEKACIGGLIC